MIWLFYLTKSSLKEFRDERFWRCFFCDMHPDSTWQDTWNIRFVTKRYIDKVLDKYGLKNCFRRDKLSLLQCPKNDLQKKQMKNIPYASAVRSLMYAQVCTRPDITYTIEKLGRYLINPGIDRWKTAKKLMQYLQKTTWNLIVAIDWIHRFRLCWMYR